MKVKKVLLSIIFMFLSFFVMRNVVDAKAPDSFTLIKMGEVYGKNIVSCDNYVQNPVYFSRKLYADGYAVLCTGDRAANAYAGTRYVKTSFPSAADGAAVAAIIKTGIGENALNSSATDYDLFFTQLAIWKYFGQHTETETHCVNKNAAQMSYLAKLYKSGTAGKSAYNSVKNFSITLNATKLTFTLSGDNYVSQLITVSGDEIKSISASVNKGTVVKSGSGYVVKVPRSVLSTGSNTIKLTFTAQSNTVPIAVNYTNGDSKQQTTTVTQFDYFSNSAVKSISGTINVEVKKVKISKKDITTKAELPGATLTLTGPNNFKETWISTNVPKEFTNLAAGKYTLTETIAPEGYVKNTSSITFTVKEDGTPSKSTVTMYNSPRGDVYISKIDATTEAELPGATLTLTGPNNFSETWISASTPKKFTNLAAGEYTLTETAAPAGYVKNTSSITFRVKEDGTVDKPVVMENTPKGDVYISKIDATTEKELPGAKLVLKNSSGKVVDSWTSSDTPHKVKVKLEAGKYTLTETIAPEGYVKNTSSITFTVKEDGTVAKPVVMKNSPKDYVYISKIDATTEKELPGATLVLKNSSGEVVDTWVSGSTPHKVKVKLVAGKYTLTEIIAPEGYVKSTSSVTFTVKEDGTVAEPVVMKNKPKEVKVNPPTGTTLMFSLMIAFVAFAVSFYYYADYKLKRNM